MTTQQEILQKLVEAQTLAAEAYRQAVVAADASVKAVEANTKEILALSNAMALHTAKQAPMEALVLKHDIALYGDQNQRGYLQRFDVIEDKVAGFLRSINAGVWVIISAALAGAGVWIWQTLSGVTK